MLDAITNLLTSIGSIPRPFWAMLGGTLVSWGITQQTKRHVPQGWSPGARDVAVRASSFGVGSMSTVGLWAITGRTDFTSALVAALIVGLWSPAVWDILMLFIGWKWPRSKFLLTRTGQRLQRQTPTPYKE